MALCIDAINEKLPLNTLDHILNVGSNSYGIMFTFQVLLRQLCGNTLVCFFLLFLDAIQLLSNTFPNNSFHLMREWCFSTTGYGFGSLC
jgi:hypothetical protein